MKRAPSSIPLVSKEIAEIGVRDPVEDRVKGDVKIGIVDLNKKKKTKQCGLTDDDTEPAGAAKGEKSAESDGVSSGSRSDAAAADAQGNIGWGRWYTLRELEIATQGFTEENVIGEGGYGVVYRGVLPDGSVAAVKNLLNKKYVCKIGNYSLSVSSFLKRAFSQKIHFTKNAFSRGALL